MKIEKINENQIRCTLTKSDLEERHIRLSELAYGSEKAKDLFRDMMQQANTEFGFEADNIPLMIEAIPVSADSIILIISKVEDPEELDSGAEMDALVQELDEEEERDEEDQAVERYYEEKLWEEFDLERMKRARSEDDRADEVDWSERLRKKRKIVKTSEFVDEADDEVGGDEAEEQHEESEE